MFVSSLILCQTVFASRVRAYHSPGLASFLLLHGPFPFTVAKNISVTIWAAPFLFSSPSRTLDPDTHPLLKVVSVICIVYLLSFSSFCPYVSFLVPRNLHKKPSGILYPHVAQILSVSPLIAVFFSRSWMYLVQPPRDIVVFCSTVDLVNGELLTLSACHATVGLAGIKWWLQRLSAARSVLAGLPSPRFCASSPHFPLPTIRCLRSASSSPVHF